MKDLFPAARIGIIGTGRVSQALALGLARYSAMPPLLWGRSPERLARACAVTGAAPTPDIATLARACDVIAIAVADDAMGTVIADIARQPLDHAPFVFHVSGGSGVGILAPLMDAGARTAAVHPAMTFTGDPALEVRRMASACFALTGSCADATADAFSLVAALGGTPVLVSEEHRALYHAALCHAANHLVTLVAGATEALAAAGVADPASLLRPLAHAALENSLARGLDALSGPVLRGDACTVAGHIAAIAQGSPQLLPAYRAMASATLEALEHSGKAINPALRAVLTPDSALPKDPVLE